MPPVLALYEDVVSNGAALALPAAARMIFLVHGGVTIAGRALGDGEAWHGEGAATLDAGTAGATCWRFELAASSAPRAAAGVSSREKLSASLDTLPAGELLLRGDSVAFPPGGCAHPHRHQGPGIRCLLEGGIRIDTNGRSHSYGPGGAWYESGPEPVFAQAAADRPSRFIRVMILPRALIGKSSLQFVDAADAAKPRAQQYQIFADAPIVRPRG
jgi:quercetin dioxygenase-like cupin family protein